VAVPQFSNNQVDKKDGTTEASLATTVFPASVGEQCWHFWYHLELAGEHQNEPGFFSVSFILRSIFDDEKPPYDLPLYSTSQGTGTTWRFLQLTIAEHMLQRSEVIFI
jgi:hypothetical protein